MKKLKLTLSGLLVLFVLASSPLAAAVFNPLNDACTKTQAQAGAICKENANQLGQTTSPSNNPIVEKIHVAADIIAVIAGAASVIIIVYSAFVFATAGGSIASKTGENTTRARQARTTLLGAVVGLVIIALAWTIVTVASSRLIK